MRALGILFAGHILFVTLTPTLSADVSCEVGTEMAPLAEGCCQCKRPNRPAACHLGMEESNVVQ